MGGNWYILVIMGVFLVLMVVMTIIPQRKQKKKMAEMMSSLTVGDKVMTIGGFVGTIVAMDTLTDRYVLDVGNNDKSTYVTVIKNAIRSKIDAESVSAAKAVTSAPVEEKEEEKKDDTKF